MCWTAAKKGIYVTIGNKNSVLFRIGSHSFAQTWSRMYFDKVRAFLPSVDPFYGISWTCEPGPPQIPKQVCIQVFSSLWMQLATKTTATLAAHWISKKTDHRWSKGAVFAWLPASNVRRHWPKSATQLKDWSWCECQSSCHLKASDLRPHLRLVIGTNRWTFPDLLHLSVFGYWCLAFTAIGVFCDHNRNSPYFCSNWWSKS